MFKKTQNYLLLNHPLLWNLKIVPTVAAAIVFHIIFFIIGYVNGAVDFANTPDWDYDNNSPVVVFFAILLATLSIVLWLVFYFRNNAYKSFYPQNKLSLFKEWMLILLVCVLNCTFSASYFYAKDLKTRSYFNEQEFSRRIDVISISSLFIKGSYKDNGRSFEEVNGEEEWVNYDTFEYNGKKYPLKSLLNKSITDFSYQNHEHDSLNEVRVKNWLVNNQKDSVRWVMGQFIKIANEHNLKSNITADEWLSLVYNYPKFKEDIIIGKIDSYKINNYTDYEYEVEVIDNNSNEGPQFDTISNTIKLIDDVYHVYPKHYVPLSQIKKSYKKISSAYVRPDIDIETLLFYLYFSLCLSMAIFSFRITSGKSWLIAIVATGIIGIITGIISIIFSWDDTFFVTWSIIIICLLVYFYSNTYKGLAKDNSAIVLNIILWLTLWLIPIIYTIVRSIYRGIYRSYDSEYRVINDFPFLEWLNDSVSLIFYSNLILVVIFMYFFTQTIKKWKGKPEA
ncbi:MAG: hypothetical protein BM557_09035 [Flavobacterium sp. MedPE-SWcel]|uniref:hypothetical protein n=1 Tax=uncultured Flavobacterium sp. TaxID=165435 RepID=UPI00091DA2DE|nr:hypothetical protein [uncultured Flavobacterium sp.]OIQ16885.1 MAG: hypothetical protein BM557_09035 [Flavobacterium sp. MedPE-SWcel]